MGNCLIHHGKQNDRVYLMGYAPQDQDTVLNDLGSLALENGYGKIVAKVPKSAVPAFLTEGYATEAIIPGYYNGKEECRMVSFFVSPERKTSMDLHVLQDIIKLARGKKVKPPDPLEARFSLKALGPDACGEMAALYKKVFKTYPYPIFDPLYLKSTMEDNIAYFGVFSCGQLVAVASGEMSRKYENAEMTDFAIDPDFRGHGLAKHLLAAAEEDMEKRRIKTLYTIARAVSAPMNCTFSAMGYAFGGTLVNNTQIAGTIESMNVWYKKL